MSFDVFDQNGNKKNMTWLQENFGDLKFHNGGSGRKFKLMRVDITEGPAVIKVRVLNPGGAPQSNQPVANRWPDSSLQSLQGGGLQSLWYDRAHIQNTDGDGFTGFGIGRGSYIKDLAKGGPHTIWVLSPSIPSDGLEGVGMLGGTNHVGPLFLTFQIVDNDDTEIVDNDDTKPGGSGGSEVSGDLAAQLQRIEDKLNRLSSHFGIQS